MKHVIINLFFAGVHGLENHVQLILLSQSSLIMVSVTPSTKEKTLKSC